MLEKIGGRKALGTIVSILVGVGIAVKQGDVPPNLLTLLITALGMFIGGNVGSKLALSRNKRTEGVVAVEGPPVVDVTPPPSPDANPEIDQLRAQLSEVAKASSMTQQSLITLTQGLAMQQQQAEAARQAEAVARQQRGF